MRRRARIAAAGLTLVLVALPAAAEGASPAAHGGRSVAVLTTARQTTRVATLLRRSGFHVDRRAGRRLQVVVRTGAQRRALERLPGVATVITPQSAYGDAIVGQGVDRTGASALADVAQGGAGLTIAVLDLGFGPDLATLQRRGELPPARRLTVASFDPAGGLVGTNAYGGPTDHGQLVAQTIYDYAPRARYVFVSYHTPDDFVAAVSWLIDQHVDIVVHSNNFLEGPFDGTGPLARAVDRAAAAGILWFNSAGNYGEKHLDLPWTDADADGYLDWPGPFPWTVSHPGGQALTFHLSWRNPPGAVPSDIDLALERLSPDGVWETIATSTDHQAAGAPPAERINGYRQDTPGEFRLRARLVSGPPPAGLLTLFAREDDIVDLSGSRERSIPTPADAAGSISVGALDFRSNTLVRYSSRGPTADGRRKPDLTAPTGTLLATPNGDPREVGGTSIAAPNAAGAAAVLLAAMRVGGVVPTVDAFRAILADGAFDIGPPGWDTAFGAGRIRVDLEPPELRTALSPPPHPVHRTFHLALRAADAGPLASWTLLIDGARTRLGHVARDLIDTAIDTTGLADGAHAASIDVADAVGNVSRRSWRFTVDNTPPVVAPTVVDVIRSSARPGVKPAQVRHRVRVALQVDDAIARTIASTITLTAVSTGEVVGRRVVRSASGAPRLFIVAAVPNGVYVLRVVAKDTAGNAVTATQPVRIRAGALA